MKICNYCGTAMDNSTNTCPFCRMDMSIRGAVKYQDNNPFDSSNPDKQIKACRTNAERKYEDEINDMGLGSSLIDFFKNSIAKRREAKAVPSAKAALKIEKQKSKKMKEAHYSNTSDSMKSISNKKNTSRNKKQASKTANGSKTGNLVLIIVVMSIITGVIPMITETVGNKFSSLSNSFFEPEAEYMGIDEFVPGTYDLGVYENEYAGIRYDTRDIFDYVSLSDENPKSFTNVYEFYASNGSNTMTITYVNKDYMNYESAESEVENHKEYKVDDNTQLVSEDMRYINSKNAPGITTYSELKSSESDEVYKFYESYIILDATDYYYAKIEIQSDTLEEIEVIMNGFENG